MNWEEVVERMKDLSAGGVDDMHEVQKYTFYKGKNNILFSIFSDMPEMIFYGFKDYNF